MLSRLARIHSRRPTTRHVAGGRDAPRPVVRRARWSACATVRVMLSRSAATSAWVVAGDDDDATSQATCAANPQSASCPCGGGLESATTLTATLLGKSWLPLQVPEQQHPDDDGPDDEQREVEEALPHRQLGLLRPVLVGDLVLRADVGDRLRGVPLVGRCGCFGA